MSTKKNEYTFFQNLQWVYQQTKDVSPMLCWMPLIQILLTLALTAATVLSPTFVVFLLENNQSFSPSLLWLVVLGIAVGTLGLSQSLMHNFRYWAALKVRLKMNVLSGLAGVHMPYEQTLSHQWKLERANAGWYVYTDDGGAIDSFIPQLADFLGSAVTIAVLTAVSVLISPWCVITIVMCCLISAVLIVGMSRWRRTMQDSLEEVWTQYYYWENVSFDTRYSQDIRLFDVQKYTAGKIQECLHKSVEVDEKITNRKICIDAIIKIIDFIRNLIILGFAVSAVFDGRIDLAYFIFFFSLITVLNSLLISASGSFIALANAHHDLLRGRDFLDSARKAAKKQCKGEAAIEAPPVIELNNVSFSYSQSPTATLHNINLVIRPGEQIALVGENGAGKTTIFNLLTGVYKPTDGDISINQISINKKTTPQIVALGVARTFQNIRLFKELSVLDNVKLAFNNSMSYNTFEAIFRLPRFWKEEKEVTDKALDLLDIFDMAEMANITAGNLSYGQQRKLEIARALATNPKLLLLDEPTNHLDIDTIEWLTNFLKNSKKTVLFITHDRYFLDNISTRIFELDSGSLIEYQGNYQDYVRLKAEQDERDAALLHKKQQLYKQELSWMRRQPQARATKQQARINRFHDLKSDLAGQTNQMDLEMNFETSRIGKKVIEFQDVDFAYGDKQILSHFNLLLQNKDRLGIVGDNGVGKSTLLNLIAGQLQPQSGQVIIGETVRVAYFSQQIEGLDESKRVINYLQEVAEEVKTGSGTTSIAELLEQFLFPRSSHGTLIEKLSGGEKKRLYLLKLLLEKPNVLLLDEPTNDLDIATLTVLENFLQGFAGPVITVSHDRYFLDKVASKILAFEDGEVREFFGNYTDYLDEKAFRQSSAAISQKKEKEKPIKAREQKKRMSYFEKQEWETIEADIEELEARIAAIETEMEQNGSDFTKLSELQKELDDKNEQLLEKYERYEYLSELE